jgi:hypothetical protein
LKHFILRVPSLTLNVISCTENLGASLFYFISRFKVLQTRQTFPLINHIIFILLMLIICIFNVHLLGIFINTNFSITLRSYVILLWFYFILIISSLCLVSSKLCVNICSFGWVFINNSALYFSDQATYWSKHVLDSNSKYWLTS